MFNYLFDTQLPLLAFIVGGVIALGLIYGVIRWLMDGYEVKLAYEETVYTRACEMHELERKQWKKDRTDLYNRLADKAQALGNAQKALKEAQNKDMLLPGGELCCKK